MATKLRIGNPLISQARLARPEVALALKRSAGGAAQAARRGKARSAYGQPAKPFAYAARLARPF